MVLSGWINTSPLVDSLAICSRTNATVEQYFHNYGMRVPVRLGVLTPYSVQARYTGVAFSPISRKPPLGRPGGTLPPKPVCSCHDGDIAWIYYFKISYAVNLDHWV